MARRPAIKPPPCARGLKNHVKGIFGAILAKDNIALRGQLLDLSEYCQRWADLTPTPDNPVRTL